MKIILGIMTAIVLAGCSTTGPVVNQTQFIVYEPPTTLYNCPRVTQFPTGDVITNRQVANAFEKLYSANRVCAANMDAIKKSIEYAKEILAE